ncbi:hypothetical protein [Streptomyces sp. MMG1121]|uniref:hypothetical protein n=1 Tax=Streptomyces sp. MMG1121 TaxID=1415544 RepID=UPI0006AF0307|nr:hypothetical protein [Streptomyces sp. MMG1121]KOV61490.1 hypothetical protein ADK64_27520 [Streptomyces sp. MMG1121]
MSTTATLIAIIVPIAIIVALAAMGLWITVRRRRLRERFGPEYSRAVSSGDSRLSSESELRSREKRHADLDLKELPPEDRERYTEQWKGLEQDFVDKPDTSVDEADRLITRVMADRGYPLEGYEQRVKDLSVEHSGTLDQYRAAHEVALLTRSGGATTEQLRGAMVRYRALFRDLLNKPVSE